MNRMATRATFEVSVSRIIGTFRSQCLRMGADMKVSLRVLKASCDDGP